MREMPKLDRLLTLKEVANILAISYATARRMVLIGELKGVKVLSSHRVRKSDLEKYIKNHKTNERTQE